MPFFCQNHTKNNNAGIIMLIKQATKERFKQWWSHEPSDRPIIRLLVEREHPLDADKRIDLSGADAETEWADPHYKIAWTQNRMNTYEYGYDAIPYIDLNYGPGSMAAYLGLRPCFQHDTVWYKHLPANSLSDIPLPVYDKEAKYFVEHLARIKKAVELSKGRYPVCIPDILENIDVLALLRGNEECCYDIMDEPETVKKYLDAIADIYMKYYDAFYDAVRFGESGRECMYTAFGIWGNGPTAKIQCDISALLSPAQFDEFVIPYLRRQTEEIEYTMYHLDGKDAIRHLPSILKLEKLNALQWTHGAGQPDGGNECWYPIYDAAQEAGKSIWISIEDGSAKEMAAKAKKYARRYANTGVYICVWPAIPEKDKVWFTEEFGE